MEKGRTLNEFPPSFVVYRAWVPCEHVVVDITPQTAFFVMDDMIVLGGRWSRPS